MPWKIEKLGKKYAVVNEMTGKISGRHDTKGEALAQQRALYASMEGMPNYKGSHVTEKKVVKDPPLPPVPGPFKPVTKQQNRDYVKDRLEAMNARGK